MLFQSIQSVLVIILIIALGYVLQQRRWFGEEFPKNISRLITDIALPASIFSSVLKYLSRSELLSLGSSLIYPMGGVAIAYIVAIVLAKVLKVRPGRRGTFINTIANANTIFIGLPLNIALFGENSMPYFLVYYVTNTVSTWVVGIFFIKADDPTKTSNSKTQHLNIKQILPAPLIGFFVAILFLIVGIPIPSFIDQTFTYVGNIVTPLALLYIGIMLFNSKLSSIRFDRDTIVALLGRFILSPLAIIGLLLLGGHLGHGLSVGLKETLIVQSATPALAILPVLAASSHGDTQYATNVVTTSTLLFVFIIPIIIFIMPYIIH
jgi:malate permease